MEVRVRTGTGERLRHYDLFRDDGGTNDIVYFVIEANDDKGLPFTAEFELYVPITEGRQQGQVKIHNIEPTELSNYLLLYPNIEKVGFRKEELPGASKVSGDWLIEEFIVTFTLASGEQRQFRPTIPEPGWWFSTGEKERKVWKVE